MSVNIREYKPSAHLKPFVELFWECRFNMDNAQIFRQQVAPNGFVELIIHPSEYHCYLPKNNRWEYSPDYTIIGLYTRPYEVRFHDYVDVFGIRFKPEGIYNLFGIPSAEFNEGYEDMEIVLGVDFKYYCSQLRDLKNINRRIHLTENYLIRNLDKNNADISYLNRAAEMIRGAQRFKMIDELPGKVYISLRQLEREFKSKMGITPKRYMRIARFNEVNRLLDEGNEVDLTMIAQECGYTDQSHFIKDFKKFMGVKPTVFIRDRHQFIVNSNINNKLSDKYI